MKYQIWDFHFSFFFSQLILFFIFFIFYVHLCCFYWVKTMLSWSSCLTPLTLLPHHSIFFFFGIVVKKRYGKRGFAIILKVTISHESHNFRYSMCDSKFNSRFSLLLSHCFLCVLCFICVHVIYIFLCFCSVFVCVRVLFGV